MPTWAKKTMFRLILSQSLQANTRMFSDRKRVDMADNSRPRANLTILGAFTGLFCTVGFLNSFGVFEAYYAEDQLANESQTTIAWIGAISIFFIFAVSVVSGPLLDLFGPGVSLLLYKRKKEVQTDGYS